jgi:hypothetical protein
MGEDALARIVKFDKVALPAIMEYKWVEAKCEKLPRILPQLFPPVSEEEELAQFMVLHEKWARPIFDVFMELGGFYYKSGQKIAANTAGVVSPCCPAPRGFSDARYRPCDRPLRAHNSRAGTGAPVLHRYVPALPRSDPAPASVGDSGGD